MADELKTARDYLSAGFNCAESVSLAVSRRLGIDKGTLPRMATPFGGGVGGSGGMCGALVGAVMAVGLRLGRDSLEGDKGPAYRLSQEIFTAFEKQMGTIICRELTGMDLRTPEGLSRLRSSEVHQRVCGRAVALAEALALDAIKAGAS